jgi:hypothetical protein
MTNWLRFWFVGWERSDFDTQTAGFLESRQKINLDVYQAFFTSARERIKSTGVLLMHLGSSPKCDMGAEVSSRAAPWFNVYDIFTENVDHCESHGVRDKGTVSGHTFLVLTPN